MWFDDVIGLLLVVYHIVYHRVHSNFKNQTIGSGMCRKSVEEQFFTKYKCFSINSYDLTG